MQSEMVGWIREIVALGVRRPGSPENLATEQYLAEKFREFGLTDVRLGRRGRDILGLRP